MEIVKPKLDVVFKMLFTRNIDLLKCFVSEILEIPVNDITDISVKDPNILPSSLEGKQSQLDLKLMVDDKIVNVEIQLCDKKDFPDRSLYYWSKIFSEELDVSEEYKLLKRTICINIVDFTLFKNDKIPYSKFLVPEENRRILLTDKFAILFPELPKIDSQIDENDRKKLWRQFLKVETEEELDMLNETNVPEIKKAIGYVQEMSADDEIRELARLREKAIRDEKATMSAGIDKGIEIGMELGQKKGMELREQQIFAALRENGFTDEQIQMLKNNLQ